tara:strand:- start:2 stop:925 length:924 start_codon:yes stop_codon:yes gene_type:complete
MAWKFKQEYVKDGDVVEPSEWRINVNESLSEINGFLDSDNLAEGSIEADMIKRNTFTDVFSSNVNPNMSFLFVHDKSGWQRTATKHQSKDFNSSAMMTTPSEDYGFTVKTVVGYEEEAQLPNVTFTPDTDGLLICEFNGWVHWHRYNLHPDYLSESGFEHDRTIYDWLHEYPFFADQKKYFKHYSSYVLCSQWRLTVNGQVVAESGQLGSEYKAHPIYLCGVAPILKNTETVVQLEAQFIWYSNGTDGSVQASSYAPAFIKPYKTYTEEPYPGEGFKRVTSEHYKLHTYRKDCSLQNPFLTAIFRKR